MNYYDHLQLIQCLRYFLVDERRFRSGSISHAKIYKIFIPQVIITTYYITSLKQRKDTSSTYFVTGIEILK